MRDVACAHVLYVIGLCIIEVYSGLRMEFWRKWLQKNTQQARRIYLMQQTQARECVLALVHQPGHHIDFLSKAMCLTPAMGCLPVFSKGTLLVPVGLRLHAPRPSSLQTC